MKHEKRPVAAILAVAFLAAGLIGCEDSDPTAPTDGVINLSVTPAVITIDPNLGETEGSSTVIAAVFNADGVPLSNVAVLFTTEAGTLASGTENVETDENGLARTTLTVLPTAPSTFTVRAQSSSVVAEASVDVEIVDDNEQPEAAVIDVPKGAQEVGKVVLFDGSASLDPDGEITCFQWEIVSTDPTGTEVIQGPGVSALQKTYTREQDLSVVLRVSDRGDAGSLCRENGAPVPIDLFSPKVEALAYKITCANTPPVAEAGPNVTQTLIGDLVFVILDGSLSTDTETPRTSLKYKWDCGNGDPASVPDPIGFPWIASCKYIAPGTYTTTLTVEDGGNISGRCVKSASDTKTVTITRLTG